MMILTVDSADASVDSNFCMYSKGNHWRFTKAHVMLVISSDDFWSKYSSSIVLSHYQSQKVSHTGSVTQVLNSKSVAPCSPIRSFISLRILTSLVKKF